MNTPADFKTIGRLGLLFGLAVLLPGLLLALIAIRAAGKEEAYLEKQYENAFVAEIDHTATVIRELLREARAELDTTTPGTKGNARRLLAGWSKRSDLVAVPFLFHRSGRFLWPKPDDPRLSAAEYSFLQLNLAFFQDRRPETIYQRKLPATKKTPLRKSTKPTSWLPERGSALAAGGVTSYTPKKSTTTKSRASSPPTIYITESLRFSQIIQEDSSGIIPRLIDDQIMLVYWKKTNDNTIIGCSLNEEELRRRVAAALPKVYTNTRIMTVLDQTGTPLVTPAGEYRPDWSTPFVAREIAELLPRWEIAAYLTDPRQVYNRARITTWALGMLVTLLLVSLSVGGIAILRSLQAEIRLAEQKTTFVANVSHELKTPLTSIRLFAELLKERRQADPEKQNRYLAIMVSETERLTRLINNVLDFSRSRHGAKRYDMRDLDLVALCRELVDNQRVRLEHNGFDTAFHSTVDTAPVRGDAEALKQALLNLMSNAEKYSPDTKWIRIEVTAREGSAIVRIADRGCGVNPEDAASIFREFYRCDDSLTSRARGTGLGLTIARQIVRDHGGDITFAPNTPSGSVFTISLPLTGERS
jgi:signal transduction histidine kinase